MEWHEYFLAWDNLLLSPLNNMQSVKFLLTEAIKKYSVSNVTLVSYVLNRLTH